MTARSLTLRFAAAGALSILILAGLIAWIEMWPLDGPGERGPGSATPGSGEAAGGRREPLPRPAPAPLPSTPAGPDGLAAGVIDLGSGAHAIGGTVVVPTGEAAAGVEVFLLDAGGGGDSDLGSSPVQPRGGAGGAPSAAREIEARLASSPRAAASAEGRFGFTGVGAGSYRLIARGAGFPPEVSEVIAVDAGRPAGSVALKLAAFAHLRGDVVAPDGSPIEGARIEARWSAPPRDPAASDRPPQTALIRAALAPDPAAVRSDAEGRFAIEGLLDGYHELLASAEGCAPQRIAEAPAGGAVLRIVLEPERFLRGQVIDQAGKPVAGAEVRLIYLAADASDAQSVVGAGGGESRRSRADPDARSGPDGRFAAGRLARGVYRAEVVHPDYVPAIVPMIAIAGSGAADESQLEIELETAHRIGGAVRSAGGEPIAGARVLALRRRLLEPGADPEPKSSIAVRCGEALTGEGGGFEITGLPAGNFTLDVFSSGYWGRSLYDVPAGGEPVEIELEPASIIEGTVIDRRSLEPVAGASISFLLEGTGAEPSPWRRAAPASTASPAARTDAGGRFRLHGLPEACRVIRVEAEGYRILDVRPMDGDAGNQAVIEKVIELDRSGSVSGAVRAPPGSPVESLRVSLLREESAPDAATEGARRVGRDAYTGRDGSFRLPLPDSGVYRVLAEGYPYAAAISRRIEVASPTEEIAGVDVLLQAAAAVLGIVHGQDGIAVAGAVVQVIPWRGPPGGGDAGVDLDEEIAARADATGAFEAHGLRAGAYRVLARAPGFISALSERFDLAPGGAFTVQIEMEPEMSIAGIVLSEEGDPVPSAEVLAAVAGGGAGEYWSEERTLSSALGTFRLSRLANRPYDLRIHAAGFASAFIERVPAGSGDLRLRLGHPVSLAGRVVGAFSGEPAQAFAIRLEIDGEDRLSAREREIIHRQRKFEDGEGAFSIENLPPGVYRIAVDAPGHLDAGGLEVELPPGAGLADLVIPLREAGLIAGTVIDGRGQPVGGARILALQRVMDPTAGRITYLPIPQPRRERSRDRAKLSEGDSWSGPGLRSRTQTRSDGAFFLRGLPDAVYRLSITHNDFVDGEIGDYTIENGAGNDASVSVRVFLDPGATLRGTVRGMAEAEGGAVIIYLSPAAGGRGPGARDLAAGARRGSSLKGTRPDPAGRFEIHGLAPGSYTIAILYRRAADGSSASIRREVMIHDLDRERGIILDLVR